MKILGRGDAVSGTLTFVLAYLAVGCANKIDEDVEAEQLRTIHERVLDAHRRGDVEDWMAVEADPYVVANRGTVTFPSAEERRAMRDPYLGSTRFSVYRDLRTPVVRVSADGTLGWVIAEVEIGGTFYANGGQTPVDEIWAWIELYEKQNGTWRLVGNVSNRRP